MSNPSIAKYDKKDANIIEVTSINNDRDSEKRGSKDLESDTYGVHDDKELDYSKEVFAQDKALVRGLEARHIQIITLVGVLGTGLFLSSGGTLYQVGNVGVFIAYIFVAIVVCSCQIANIEIATLMPVTGGPIRHAEHFVDKAAGFALGWINVYASIIPGELSATAVIMTYWTPISPAVWLSIFGVIIIATNCYSVRFYGEVEFVFGILKITLLFGLVIVGLVIDLGGAPNDDRIGFRYWKESPWKTYWALGSLGRFLAFWKCVSGVVYAFNGVQGINLLAGETQYPRRSIHRAGKRIIIRTISMYLVAIFILSLILSSKDPKIASSTGNAEGSPWVIAITRAGIKVLPHIINAVVLTSAFSAANLGLVSSSRTLFALAAKKQAPKIFLKTTKRGVPIYGIIFGAIFMPLVYMSVSTASSTVFSWFQSISSGNALLSWISISTNHLFMNRALKAQGYSRDRLPYKIRGGLFFSWFNLIMSIILLLTQGFQNFLHGNFNVSSFISTYIIIPIFLVLYGFWKIFKRTSIIKPEDVDLKSLFDDIEENPEPPMPKLKGWEYLTILWA